MMSSDVLAEKITEGHAAILGIDARYIWPEYLCTEERLPHAVTIVGMEKEEGKLLGFWINDTGYSDSTISKPIRFIDTKKYDDLLYFCPSLQYISLKEA